jgi:hypothetical protein
VSILEGLVLLDGVVCEDCNEAVSKGAQGKIRDTFACVTAIGGCADEAQGEEPAWSHQGAEGEHVGAPEGGSIAR